MGLQVYQAMLDQRGRQENPAMTEKQELLVRKDPLDHLDHLAHLVLEVREAPLVTLETLGPQVNKEAVEHPDQEDAVERLGPQVLLVTPEPKVTGVPQVPWV